MKDFGDTVKSELDKRKLQELVDSGKINASDVANAPIYSVSECCGADMLAEYPDGDTTCEKCGQPCTGAVE